VPQQALFMMNSPFAVNQAKALAARPDVAEEKEPGKRVEKMYRRTMPDADIAQAPGARAEWNANTGFSGPQEARKTLSRNSA